MIKNQTPPCNIYDLVTEKVKVEGKGERECPRETENYVIQREPALIGFKSTCSRESIVSLLL